MVWPQGSPATPYDNDPSNWMSQLDDSLLVRDLSIPGTHDSTALRGFTHVEESVTQNLKVEEQLSLGIRFLDLRVKRKSTNDLAMWHGSDFIWDPYQPGTSDQLYFQTVIEKIVGWLEAHPREAVIIMVKDEEGDGVDVSKDIGQRAYGILTDVNQRNNAPTNPNYHGMWHGHTVDCTLGQVRGRLILWQRFTPTYPDDDAGHPGVDFNQMNTVLDNTTGDSLQTAAGSTIGYVQDYYSKAALADKMRYWLDTARLGYIAAAAAGQQYGGQQFLHHVSKAGKTPAYNANVLNPCVTEWLNAMRQTPTDRTLDPNQYRYRSGIGVVPLDFPDPDVVGSILAMNFTQTYAIYVFASGKQLYDDLIAKAGKSDD